MRRLVVVALLHQELLPPVRVIELLGVARDHGVEEGIEATRSSQMHVGIHTIG